jgi:hypothetical protein
VALSVLTEITDGFSEDVRGVSVGVGLGTSDGRAIGVGVYVGWAVGMYVGIWVAEGLAVIFACPSPEAPELGESRLTTSVPVQPHIRMRLATNVIVNPIFDKTFIICIE